MDERKRNWITWSFVALTVLVIAAMMSSTLRRTNRVELPDTDESPDFSAGADAGLTVVEVTPETVQTAIATLHRPEAYRRTITVEQFWSTGSATTETAVAVLAGWTRTDRTLSGGQTRHTITDGQTTYIWYNSETSVYETAAGDITADEEQGIPTYETVLELPTADIAMADYRAISGVNCIYVETVENADGYIERYWVGVDTGLLMTAERLVDEEPVYRMAALTVDMTAPTAADFTLPDGRILVSE